MTDPRWPVPGFDKRQWEYDNESPEESDEDEDLEDAKWRRADEQIDRDMDA